MRISTSWNAIIIVTGMNYFVAPPPAISGKSPENQSSSLRTPGMASMLRCYPIDIDQHLPPSYQELPDIPSIPEDSTTKAKFSNSSSFVLSNNSNSG